MKNKRVRQGQSRWIAVVYKPGFGVKSINVYQCFVSGTTSSMVWYKAGRQVYECSPERFLQITAPSFRKAAKAGLELFRSNYQ